MFHELLNFESYVVIAPHLCVCMCFLIVNDRYVKIDNIKELFEP